MTKFNKKGLNCEGFNTNATNRQEKEYGRNAEITELYIEDRKYSQSGHLNENEIKKWADEILKDANTDPQLWKKEEPEYDRWGRQIN